MSEDVRYYTVEEARRLLPQLIPLLRAIQKQAALFKEVQTAVKAARAIPIEADGNLTANPWYDEDDEAGQKASEAFDEAVAALAKLSIEMKDPERGLIDFLHERDGQVVYLCFELGETDIEYWHTLHGGFAARQPL
jgi:hypothetical protein